MQAGDELHKKKGRWQNANTRHPSSRRTGTQNAGEDETSKKNDIKDGHQWRSEEADQRTSAGKEHINRKRSHDKKHWERS